MSSSQQNEAADLESANTIADDVGSNGKNERSESCVPECSVEMVDLEIEARAVRDCRICFLSFDATNNKDSGIPIELGCSCKDDLGVAHKQCAEAWFKIKGNKTCEICGSIAQNIVGANVLECSEQQRDETREGNAAAILAVPPPRNFCKGHKFLNLLLACMVFALVISWIFHFNSPS